MDTNKNKKIDAEEFRSFIARLGFTAHPMTVSRIFEAIDEDGDGEITAPELTRALMPGAAGVGKTAQRTSAKDMLARAQQWQSGKLGAGEGSEDGEWEVEGGDGGGGGGKGASKGVGGSVATASAGSSAVHSRGGGVAPKSNLEVWLMELFRLFTCQERV